MQNILYLSVLSIGIVILSGFVMANKRMKRQTVSNGLKLTHGIFTIIGAVTALIAAFSEAKLWINIVLAIIIVALGLYLAFGKPAKERIKRILYMHAGIAIICYITFLYFVFIG